MGFCLFLCCMFCFFVVFLTHCIYNSRLRSYGQLSKILRKYITVYHLIVLVV